jgi:glycosyltransferase involved in cell wall biosynthesis
MNPTVSIIMPCLNGERHIQTAINSVQAQTFGDFELIVVDNGSTDRTPEILRSVNDPRLKILALSERGVSRARNLGLREARGAFIAFLDADDEWAPDFIEKMIVRLENRPEYALAYCGWRNIGTSGIRGEPYIPPDYEGVDKLAALLVDCPWPIHAALTRREVIQSVGGFNPRFAIGEDFLLWLEIATSHPIVRIPEVLAYYHHHGGQQVTKSKVQVALTTAEVQKHFLSSHPEIARTLGHKKTRRAIYGTLLDRGYAYYWRRDLVPARTIFRRVMKSGYGTLKDWLYMLPSLIPLILHRKLIQIFESRS